MRQGLATLCVVLICSALLVTPIAGASGTADQPADADEPTLYVELTADGDATVSLVSVYDLTSEDERDAFETIDESEQDRDEMLTRFTDRMQSVAANADAGAENAVTADAIDLQTSGDRGIVVLSVEWESLAAVENGQLTLTEPFASGYETDRALVVDGPDGATIESATPEPTETTDAQASWDAGTDLNGFELTFALADDDTDGTADDSVPGFGVVVTAVSLLALIGVGLRCQS